MTDTKLDDIMRLRQVANRIARQPTVNDLWKLRGILLACALDQPQTALVHEVTREFYVYLSELQSKMTARQYSELASRMDMSAIGVLALQDIVSEHQELWKNLLLGGLSEGLMVLASRQYIKAWEQELRSVHRHAAWTLYGVLWQVSCRYQPDMSSAQRQELIETSLAPALDENTPFDARTLLMARLFQMLLLLLVAPLCDGSSA